MFLPVVLPVTSVPHVSVPTTTAIGVAVGAAVGAGVGGVEFKGLPQLTVTWYAPKLDAYP